MGGTCVKEIVWLTWACARGDFQKTNLLIHVILLASCQSPLLSPHVRAPHAHCRSLYSNALNHHHLVQDGMWIHGCTHYRHLLIAQQHLQPRAGAFRRIFHRGFVGHGSRCGRGHEIPRHACLCTTTQRSIGAQCKLHTYAHPHTSTHTHTGLYTQQQIREFTRLRTQTQPISICTLGTNVHQ